MTQNLGSSRARQEVEARRKNFYAKTKKPVKKRQYTSDWSENESLIVFSEFTMRRLAPIAMVIHASTILFFVSWLLFGAKSKVAEFSIDMNAPIPMQSVFLPKANTLYAFDLSQAFNPAIEPLYSELEIEIRRDNYDHVYSFYKDLWQERYADDGGSSIYSDRRMEFSIVLPEAGSYFIKATSHNGNLGAITGKCFSVFGATMYFKIYAIVFGSLSVILILLSGKWGSPFEMLAVLPRIKAIRRNKFFWTVLGISAFLYLFSVYAALTNYGYPAGGGETVLPSAIFSKNDVFYLG